MNRETASPKILLPKNDLIFKLLFGDERNLEIMTVFLKAVLRLPEEEYEEVTLIDTHLKRQYEGDKLGILDVRVRTKSHKSRFRISMQASFGPIFRQTASAHACRHPWYAARTLPCLAENLLRNPPTARS